MKIAVFYPLADTAWSITKGICAAFSRKGHEVTDCGPSYSGSLDGYNLIFISGPEYLWKILRERYPLWDYIRTPKVGWLHETVEREDYGGNPIAVGGKLPIEELKNLTTHLLTPAIQDQRYGMSFLPFGVDTKMFYPRLAEKDFGGIYTGPLYKKRREFLEKYPEVRTLVRHVYYNTTEEYAEALGRATVVLSLPSLSEASNVRVLETLASKTALVAPSMPYPDSFFVHGKHLLYYQGNPAPVLRDLSPSAAEKMAQTGFEEVTTNHTIDLRLEEVFRMLCRPLRKFSRKT